MEYKGKRFTCACVCDCVYACVCATACMRVCVRGVTCARHKSFSLAPGVSAAWLKHAFSALQVNASPLMPPLTHSYCVPLMGKCCVCFGLVFVLVIVVFHFAPGHPSPQLPSPHDHQPTPPSIPVTDRSTPPPPPPPPSSHPLVFIHLPSSAHFQLTPYAFSILYPEPSGPFPESALSTQSVLFTQAPSIAVVSTGADRLRNT